MRAESPARANRLQEGVELFEKYIRPVLAQEFATMSFSAGEEDQGEAAASTASGIARVAENGSNLVPGDRKPAA